MVYPGAGVAIEVAMVVTEAAVDKAEEEVATFMAIKVIRAMSRVG